MTSNRKRYYRPEISSLNISQKANRILNIVLLSLILILLRIWFLSVVQYDEKVEESKKPQRKVVMEPAKRGTIRDRFNIPLAINKIQYQATVVYSEILQIPSVIWEKNEAGKLVKRFKRKEYITNLSNLLGLELQLDPSRIEDLIYSKASFYHQFPFIIKDEVDEKCYYRLKMLEKDWLGIHAQCVPKRHYPKNHVAADILGYMGAINRKEYETIMQEIKSLADYIKEYESGDLADLPEGIESHDRAILRLKELEANAYTINDYVGKMGVEGFFEDHLRGYQGRKSFYSDSRGNFLRELPGKTTPLSGMRLLLTISAELQEFAEELLTKNETIRSAVPSNRIKQTLLSLRQPWIKGGAIIAIDPNNGEVFALASYPRFNPNDFISSGNPALNKEKQSNINRWFESESYIAEIWDQKRPLERERFDNKKEIFFEEKRPMDLKNYLDFILPKTNDAYREITRLDTLDKSIAIQQNAQNLILLSGQENAYFAMNALYNDENHETHKPLKNEELKYFIETNYKKNADEISKIKKNLDPYFSSIKSNYDKVLLADLCRLLVPAHLFSESLIQEVGKESISSYRDVSASMNTVTETVRSMTKDLFHTHAFLKWRAEFEKPYLKEKRLQEKIAKKHQKPYIEYFDAEERQMFQAFWQEHHLNLTMAFLTGRNKKSAIELKPYLDHFKKWHKELKDGLHEDLSWYLSYFTLKNSVSKIRLELISGYLKTLRSYSDLTRPLLGSYRYLRKESDGKQLEKHLAAAFYPKPGFGYCRSQGYRQSTTQGSIFKLVTAYETLIQRYNKLDPQNLNFKNLNPLDIVDSTHRHGKDISLGFFHDGTPIPRLYKGGRLLKSSRNGIGQIDLIKAIETSSNPYFSLLAIDCLNSPDDLSKCAKLFSFGNKTGIELTHELSGKVPDDISYNRTGLYAMANGQHSLIVTPLQTAVFLSSLANGGKVFKPSIVKMRVQNNLETNKNVVVPTLPKIQRIVFMPEIIRGMLLEGMRLIVQKQTKANLANLTRLYKDYPQAIRSYVAIKDQFIGKTSTSESTENLNLDLDHGTNLYTHIWFGSIAFHSDLQGLSKNAIVFKDSEGRPELVVVVYLKYGTFGWESAPVAAEMVQKWREIKSRH